MHTIVLKIRDYYVQEKIDITDKNTKYIKQLDDDLLKLQIENEYLKKLRELYLKEEA